MTTTSRGRASATTRTGTASLRSDISETPASNSCWRPPLLRAGPPAADDGNVGFSAEDSVRRRREVHRRRPLQHETGRAGPEYLRNGRLVIVDTEHNGP